MKGCQVSRVLLSLEDIANVLLGLPEILKSLTLLTRREEVSEDSVNDFIKCGPWYSLNELFYFRLVQLHGMLDIECDDLLLVNEELVVLGKLRFYFIEVPLFKGVSNDQGAALIHHGVGTVKECIHI